jgi:1-acyl-sn-glycerol-3-phosphate acyltransferase
LLLLIRGIFVAVKLIVIGTVGTLVHLFRPFYTGTTYVLAQCLGFLATKILGLKIFIKNKERITDSGACVYVSNHQSNTDLLVCGEIISRRTVSIGKKSLVFIPFFGLLYWLIGNILIDRKNIRNSLAKMNRDTDRTLNEKDTSIWIFPEGTRNATRTLLPFKRGAFRIAIQSRVPIVPVCISSYAGTINFNRLRSGEINVKVLNPISTKNLKTADAADLADTCQKLLQDTLTLLNTEKESASPA